MPHALSTRDRRSFLGGVLAAGAVAWPARARSGLASIATERIVIGDTPVQLLVEDYPLPGVTYVHLHENETTAAEAAAHVVRPAGGRLVRVRAQGTRFVSFMAAGKRYTFDPNRIFTPAGVARTLRHHGTDGPIARAQVTAFGERVLRTITAPTPRLVIAPHNNSAGAYSIRSYISGAPLARDAAQIHLSRSMNPDDFCVVTDVALFEGLKGHDVNVALQDLERVDDDGSLAVYCQRYGLRYVNVEARYGRFREQVALLELARRVAL